MNHIQKNLNIVLIGMPGVGKSTLGVLAAKQLGCPFIDTDILIQSGSGERLKEIISRRGIEFFKSLEEQYVCKLDVKGAVIATGGSVVYSSGAIKHLSEKGCIVWLSLSYDNLLDRLGDLDARGVIRATGQSLSELYQERQILYAQYSDMEICCDGLNHDAALTSLIAQVETIRSFGDLARLRKHRKESVRNEH